MKQLKMWYWSSLVFLLLMVACTPEPATFLEQATKPPVTVSPTQTVSAAQPQPTATAVSQPTIDATQPLRLTPVATLQLEIVPTQAETAVVGEVPEDILTAVYTDLVKTQNAAREAITLVRAEATIWNDGALGCPQPGQVYTQAVVNGYLIVLEIDGHTYSYHAAENGYFILCQNNLAPSPPVVGTPVS